MSAATLALRTVALAVALSACDARSALPTYDYARCTDASACGEGADCHVVTWRDGSGGMCTAPCSGRMFCPHAGRCLDVSSTGDFLCYGPCAADADCRAGLVCQPLTSGGSVCLPM